MEPKISIITINYNNKIGLLDTIKSVIVQSYDNYEFIIIDGNSNDGSKDVIYEHKTYLTYSVSEADNGIYHAMNKGTRKAKGEYLLYLNSGDTLYNKNVLKDIVPHLTSSVDICYANINYVGKDYSWTKDYSKEIINFDFFVKDTLPHQASFIKNSMLNNLSFPYDETLKICADWKFFIDAIIKNNASLKHAPVIVSNYNFDGFSSLPENKSIIILERLNVLMKDYAELFASSFDNLLKIQAKYNNFSRSRPIKAYLKLRNKFS
ncbi:MULTISPECIES: glycosyltransferase family 2 protein [Sphingobacterium]|uniref:glycosyltransferase family 2 protein n=1 Tax=Sphingobacterium TaxID=28453 RepID=UPI00257B180E|nr:MULTISPECIES: glycosyltransferase family 2 protein [Sphingobacterium]